MTFAADDKQGKGDASAACTHGYSSRDLTRPPAESDVYDCFDLHVSAPLRVQASLARPPYRACMLDLPATKSLVQMQWSTVPYTVQLMRKY